jgi:hypothetical protein
MAQISGFDYPFYIQYLGDGENTMYVWFNIKGASIGAEDADGVQQTIQAALAAISGVSYSQVFRFSEDETDVTVSP